MLNKLPESIKIVVEALKDKKVEDLAVLDVTGLVPYTDYFIIGTGNNAPHVQTLADTVAKLVKIPNVGGVRLEADQTSTWVLIDGGEFVLHIFQPKARKFYNLEDLWEDAARIEA
ncbi:MAG TPA: ribosome silencing factor [Candidatus Rifleibacterium sp.]|nr:ribosome silencing factor [Candidatus Rifleibacterium sp.]HPT45147.1 ribosome silencing factor [Candidatus Rifleibacterium sp.]